MKDSKFLSRFVVYVVNLIASSVTRLMDIMRCGVIRLARMFAQYTSLRRCYLRLMYQSIVQSVGSRLPKSKFDQMADVISVDTSIVVPSSPSVSPISLPELKSSIERVVDFDQEEPMILNLASPPLDIVHIELIPTPSFSSVWERDDDDSPIEIIQLD